MNRYISALCAGLLLAGCTPPNGNAANAAAAPAQAIAEAEAPYADLPPVPKSEQFPNMPDGNHPDKAIYTKAPAFAGMWVDGSRIFIGVASDDPAEQQAAYQAFLEENGGGLGRYDTENPTFVRVKYSMYEMAQARRLAYAFPGWSEVGSGGGPNNKVIVGLNMPENLTKALALMRRYGVPEDIYDLNVPEALADLGKDTFQPPHTSRLEIPASIPTGEIAHFNFLIINTGNEAFDIPNYLCGSFYWLVRYADTGEIVRPFPTGYGCYSKGGRSAIKPGETRSIFGKGSEGLSWYLDTSSGERLPPGDYILQASLRNFGRGTIRPPDAHFTITEGLPDGGIADAAIALTGLLYRHDITASSKVVSVGGKDMLHITTQGEKVQAFIQNFALEHDISLARVQFEVLPPLPVVPSGDDTQIAFKGTPYADKITRRFIYGLRPDMQQVRALAKGASRAELFTHIVNVEGQRVYANSDSSPRPLPYRMRDGIGDYLGQEYLDSVGYMELQWETIDNTGKQLPAGRYVLRTGLRFSYPDEPENWLTTAPQIFVLGEPIQQP